MYNKIINLSITISKQFEYGNVPNNGLVRVDFKNQDSDWPFYYSSRLNFGYGYNLTARNGPGILAGGYLRAQPSRSDRLPQPLIPIETLNDFDSYFNSPAAATLLNESLAKYAPNTDWRIAASIVAKHCLRRAAIYLEHRLAQDHVIMSHLPVGVAAALLDRIYNTGWKANLNKFTDTLVGSQAIADLHKRHYGLAAYEFAGDYAHPGQHGEEKRLLAEAMLMLGFTKLTFDGGQHIQGAKPSLEIHLNQLTAFLSAMAKNKNWGSAPAYAQHVMPIIDHAAGVGLAARSLDGREASILDLIGTGHLIDNYRYSLEQQLPTRSP